jgi:putative tryptophan/tyrosine transport system substrate-binding protein
MRRRELLLLLGGATTAPRSLHSQQKPIPVIGFLSNASPDQYGPYMAAIRQGLSEAGYAEGQNLAIEYRWAEGDDDRLPALAADLVALKVDAIITTGGTVSALPAKNATATIPIVSVIGIDPVAAGLIDSLARPGGNLTGVAIITVELIPKRFELLFELVPQAAVIGLLVNPKNPNTERMVRDTREAARGKGVRLAVLEARSVGGFAKAFTDLGRTGAGGLVVAADPFFNVRREELVALAARQKVPAIYEWREFVDAGGLISYGPNLLAIDRLVGIYTGRILGGAKPADLPVQQPTTFELVINLKTANALGLTVSPSILARADEVIE